MTLILVRQCPTQCPRYSSILCFVQFQNYVKACLSYHAYTQTDTQTSTQKHTERHAEVLYSHDSCNDDITTTTMKQKSM